MTEGGRDADSQRRQDDFTDIVDLTADPILETLVEVAQRVDGFGYGITLMADGVVVSGLLVGAGDWLDEFARVHVDAPALSGEEASGDWARTLAERFTPASDDDDRRYGHIHLRDARFFSGAELLPHGGGALWRGRLAAVSGWSPGVASASSDRPVG